MTETDGPAPQSLLPYEDWTQAALRQVAIAALAHAAEHGLPGGHHFYVTFRTDHPAAILPKRLRAQYPQEMTIVLQHQYWDLKVDQPAGEFSVGLSFGGVPTTVHVPFAAITGFADPEVRFGLQFKADVPDLAGAEPVAAEAADSEPPAPALPAPDGEAAETPQVVSLDAFRRKPKS